MRRSAMLLASLLTGANAQCELIGCTEQQLINAYQAKLDTTDCAPSGSHTSDTTKWKCNTAECTTEQIAEQFNNHLDCNSGCGSNKDVECPQIIDQMHSAGAVMLQTLDDSGKMVTGKTNACENDVHDGAYTHFDNLNECWNAIVAAGIDKDVVGSDGNSYDLRKFNTKFSSRWSLNYVYGCRIEAGYMHGKLDVVFYEANQNDLNWDGSRFFPRKEDGMHWQPGAMVCKKAKVDHYDDCTCENGLNKGPLCLDREAKLDVCTECNEGFSLNGNNKCV